MPKYNTFISTASHIGNISEPPVTSVHKHANIIRKAARLTPAKLIFHPAKVNSSVTHSSLHLSSNVSGVRYRAKYPEYDLLVDNNSCSELQISGLVGIPAH